MKKRHRTTPDSMEEEKQEVTDTDPTIFTDSSDLCQQLLDRYGKSSAPQHRHLCATAAATRSILQSESLPLTPVSYFAASIEAVSVKTLDSDAVSALSAFLGIVLPLVPENSIAPEKAADAVAVLVEMVERRPSEAVLAPGVRALVKCLGVLVGFCDLEDWESVKLGFETLLKFSIDKRPKVRRCAQDCVLKAFKSFKSSAVIKEASKFVLFMLKGYTPLATTIGAMEAKDGPKDETLLKPEDLAVLHFLNVLKLLVPCLSVKVSFKVLAQLHKLISSQFSVLTRHIFGIIETMFETPGGEVAVKEVENIIESLASYISLGEKNPSDTILSAATLSKSALDKLYTDEPTKWISNLPLVVGSVVGLLTSEASASQASVILKELINQLTDTSDFSSVGGQPVDDEVKSSKKSKAVESICSVFHNVLSACGKIPNEHILAVISVLFIKLGKRSYFYTKSILLKLAEIMTIACRDNFDRKHLEECIGFAVSAIGPEKILALIPISFNAEDRTCSNIWLIPILKNYVVGSSLGFFMQHVVPLAESLQRACRKVKKSEIGEDLQAHARGCWGLLSAFCRSPTDTYENFGPLAKLLIPFLTKDSWMLENAVIALQELVNENRSAPGSNQRAGEFEKVTKTCDVNNSLIELKNRFSYSKKIASRNIKALASCSEELLQAIVDVLFDSPPEKHACLKDTIECLASITDSAVIKKIFISSRERFQLIDSSGEDGKMGGHSNASVDEVHDISASAANRCLIMELASSLVGGASEDLVYLIYSFVKQTLLREADENGQHEAYYTLSRILEEHSWFCTSQFIELMDFLLGLKSPFDVASLRSRFACFQILLIHAIKRSSDDENAKAFLILNEIIVTIKDSKEEGRKAAYDILLGINSCLRDSSSAISDGPYHKLISMIMGYLSGSSPQIKSGAVSALSVLVHDNAEICLLIPDLVPSVLALLQTKAVEVVKAALGFVKVLVSCLEARDLHKILPDAITGVLSWSSISRHHFRSKVTVIFEIMMRKCGSAAVESLAPEKYRGFVKSVSEGRHGKTSSKETGSNDAPNKISDSSPRGSFRQQNRKRKESNISPEEDGSREPRKREWENHQKGNGYTPHEPRMDSGGGNGAKGVKRPRFSSHGKPSKGLSRGGLRNGRNFNRDPSGSGKRTTEQSKGNKKSEAADNRNVNASKLTKHKKVARKGQKFNNK